MTVSCEDIAELWQQNGAKDTAENTENLPEILLRGHDQGSCAALSPVGGRLQQIAKRIPSDSEAAIVGQN
jgi:hypothetical protein